MKKDFFLKLISLNWIVNFRDKEIDPKWDSYADGRFVKAPAEIKEFISSYSLCTNADDTIWFLTLSDYENNPSLSFPWNEFENQSKEYADESMLMQIDNFWKKHIPFLFSVKNGYAFLAYCIEGENEGKIYYGAEPEYEEVLFVSNSLDEFKKGYINALANRTKSSIYNMLI